MGNRRGLDAFTQSIAGYQSLSFDTNAVIYFLDDVEPYYPLVERALSAVESGEKSCTLSVITELELLVLPLREGNQAKLAQIADFFRVFPGVGVVGVSREIARRAAAFRAEKRLRLADAIIVATALEEGCHAIIGNDNLCARRVKEIPYLYLEDFVS